MIQLVQNYQDKIIKTKNVILTKYLFFSYACVHNILRNILTKNA